MPDTPREARRPHAARHQQTRSEPTPHRPRPRRTTPAFGDVLAACAAADAVSTPPRDEERRRAA
ncbi:hypothetical protein GL263_27200 [Streptomyces durbertensis]|uniref:Uncharacterized protein n=2 Tax=Streptomyces durbertensis TaxID=2448886 RepID=A0ABR6EPE9_9ACTN|nr:hypothetical protein [Streptomyces durbertensis]